MDAAKIQLLSVLQEAISQDYIRIRQAEETLKQWETEACFVTVMQDIFYDKSIEHNIRFMSGIYLKNGLDRFWATNLISLEEKQLFRERLLQFVQEPSRKLTMQNAIIAAKIARLDYPSGWPQLFSGLFQSIESASLQNIDQARLMYDRILEMLNEILATKVTGLEEVASNVFQAVARIYLVHTDSAISLVPQVEKHTILRIDMDIAKSCMKCLRILMMNYIKDFHKFDETKTMIGISFNHLDQFMQCRTALIQFHCNQDIQAELEELIEEYGLFYLGIQKAHPVSTALCPSWLSILQFYWQDIVAQGTQIKSGRGSIFEQHLLRGMLLINSTIKSFSLQSAYLRTIAATLTEEERGLEGEAARLIQNQLLTQEFVHNCTETLITQYMQLTTEDLALWSDDPEEWANAADTENWEFELRPCAETTFMNLLKHYPDQLVPIILDLVGRMENVADEESLLLKDAVYAAVGLGVHSLFGKLDFESLIVHRLVAEVVNKDHQYKILRRRIAWILGKWIAKDVSVTCKRVIYEMFIRLMAKNEDIVVRLTAAFGLKQAVDDLDFDITIAITYLGSLMASLINLLSDCEDSDTTMKLISTVNTIMDKGDRRLAPYASQLIQLLVPLWSSAVNPLLQSSLVITFTKLTSILNERSFQLQPFLIPMLAHCTNPSNEAHIYLLEDSLNLWWTMLQTTPMPTPFMMPLFPKALELIDYDADNLTKLLKIIESYVLLDSRSTLQEANLSMLFTKLASKIIDTKADDAHNISHTLDLVFQSIPVQAYANVLVQSGLLTNILVLLIRGQLYDYAIMSYMNLFARLAIYDANFVIQAIQLIGQEQQPTREFVDTVLELWVQKFSSINQSRAKKLFCLGFTSLLATKEPVVIKRLPEIMTIWAEVGLELADENASKVEEDTEKDAAEIKNCAEERRKAAVYRNDPVTTIDMIHHIKQVANDLSSSNLPLAEQLHQFL